MKIRETYIRRGSITLMVLLFLAIFLLMISTVGSFMLEENKYANSLIAREQAFQVAESGLEYYRWYLAHFPNDTTNGTTTPGPYPYTVNDPETGALEGTAQISINSRSRCGLVQWVDITSVGTSASNSLYKRTLYARYMRPSFASYAYLENANTEETAGTTIIGPYFSNGGIHMDGTNNSDVSSAQSTWTCTLLYGCDPSKVQPGVFGSGSGSALWHYPVASIDFTGGLSLNLSTIKTVSQTYGLYFPPTNGVAGQRGYHFVFKNNGTLDVYKVSSVVQNIWSFPDGATATHDYGVIKNQSFVGNYAIPASCPVVFAEDTMWVDGVVGTSTTIANADYSGSGVVPNAYLPNNITYTAYDGSVGLTLVSDGSVYIPLNSPNVMELHGIFVAHTGNFGRPFYLSKSMGNSSYTVPLAYDSYVLGSQLTLIGTVATNGISTTDWQFSDNSTVTVSGYTTRIDSYDELQSQAPPPLTPSASANYKFIIWDER